LSGNFAFDAKSHDSLLIQSTLFIGAPAPACLPALGEFTGIPCERFDVYTEWALRRVAGLKRVIDQLQVRSAGLAESLGLQ
jgi:hypothetical protein